MAQTDKDALALLPTYLRSGEYPACETKDTREEDEEDDTTDETDKKRTTAWQINHHHTRDIPTHVKLNDIAAEMGESLLYGLATRRRNGFFCCIKRRTRKNVLRGKLLVVH